MGLLFSSNYPSLLSRVKLRNVIYEFSDADRKICGTISKVYKTMSMLSVLEN